MRRWVSAFAIILGVCVGSALCINPVLERIFITQVQASTGYVVTVKNFSFDVFHQGLRLTDTKVFAPGRADVPVALVPYVTAVVDVRALWGQVLHVKDLQVDIQELRITLDKEQRQQLFTLKSPAFPQPDTVVKDIREMSWQLDRVVLSLDRVIIETPSQKREESPRHMLLTLNLKKKEFYNINSWRQIKEALGIGSFFNKI